MASVSVRADDPELTDTIQEIPPKFHSRHAQVVADAGYYKKALRICECGRRMRKRAPDNCTVTLLQHCRTGFCDYCAGMLVDELCERWHRMLDLSIELARAAGIRRFTLVTILQPIASDTTQIKEFFGKINQADILLALRKIKRDAVIDIDPLLKRLRGHIAGSADTRVLYLHENLSTGDWLSLFPKASVRVWYFPIERLHEVFKDSFLSPYIPKDGAERGRQEVLFDGIHRFGADGISPGKKTPAESDDSKFTEVPETPVNLADSPVSPGRDCGMGKCSHGCFYNERTRWFKVGEPIPPGDLTEYEPVAPLLVAG